MALYVPNPKEAAAKPGKAALHQLHGHHTLHQALHRPLRDDAEVGQVTDEHHRDRGHEAHKNLQASHDFRLNGVLNRHL